VLEVLLLGSGGTGNRVETRTELDPDKFGSDSPGLEKMEFMRVELEGLLDGGYGVIFHEGV